MRKQRNPVRSLSLIAIGVTGIIFAVTRREGIELTLNVRRFFGMVDMIVLPGMVISTVLRQKYAPEGGSHEKRA